MLGYGLLNAKIQEFCLSGIIRSFLNRSVIYLYPLYLNYNKKSDDKKNEILTILYEIFVQEELRLSTRLFKNFNSFKQYEELSNPKASSASEKDIITLYYIDDETKKIVEARYGKDGFLTSTSLSETNFNRYPDLIIKYILSANVVYDKDYDFASKTIEEVEKDGKNNLRKLFDKTFNEFYNSPYFGVSNQTQIQKINFESYYDSFKKLLTDEWLLAYAQIDFDEEKAINWWNNGGGLNFTNTLQDLTNKLKNLVNNNNLDEAVEKDKLISNILNLTEKINIAINNAPSFLDVKGIGESIFTETELNKGQSIIPLNPDGTETVITRWFKFIDEDGDLRLKEILNYYKSFLDYYYKILTGQVVIKSGIYQTILRYIENCVQYGAGTKDDLETTLNNLTIYFIKEKGYLNNLNEIIKFYKQKEMLNDRSFYIKLLTNQINSLQTDKVDIQERYYNINT
jgi:hypothetical protein